MRLNLILLIFLTATIWSNLPERAKARGRGGGRAGGRSSRRAVTSFGGLGRTRVRIGRSRFGRVSGEFGESFEECESWTSDCNKWDQETANPGIVILIIVIVVGVIFVIVGVTIVCRNRRRDKKLQSELDLSWKPAPYLTQYDQVQPPTTGFDSSQPGYPYPMGVQSQLLPPSTTSYNTATPASFTAQPDPYPPPYAPPVARPY